MGESGVPLLGKTAFPLREPRLPPGGEKEKNVYITRSRWPWRRFHRTSNVWCCHTCQPAHTRAHQRWRAGWPTRSCFPVVPSSPTMHGVRMVHRSHRDDVMPHLSHLSQAHNPEVVYSPLERKYILFTLGHDNASAPLACTPDGRPVGTWGGHGAPPWLSDVSMFTADGPGGPWSPRLDPAGYEAVIAAGLNANPTAHVDATTGEITLLYGRFDRPHSPHNRLYSVLTAASTVAPWVPLGDLPASLTPPRNCSQARQASAFNSVV